MSRIRSVQVLPAPAGATLGWLTVRFPCLGTFMREDQAVRCARHVHAPQIILYRSPGTGLLAAFEPIPLPGTQS